MTEIKTTEESERNRKASDNITDMERRLAKNKTEMTVIWKKIKFMENKRLTGPLKIREWNQKNRKKWSKIVKKKNLSKHLDRKRKACAIEGWGWQKSYYLKIIHKIIDIIWDTLLVCDRVGVSSELLEGKKSGAQKIYILKY